MTKEQTQSSKHPELIREDPWRDLSSRETPGHLLHASTVALFGKAILIAGPSGSGKSSLALQLMALGADLVADDRTGLSIWDRGLLAEAPPPIAGQIEARGFGVLRAGNLKATPSIAVELSMTAPQRRLPHPCELVLLDCALPLYRTSLDPYVGSKLFHLMKFGSADPETS